jgi:deoxycytidylate deaminase
MEHMKYAYQLATKSLDESSQNGAVIVVGDSVIGEYYNQPPHKQYPLIQDRPRKYWVFEHAESGAIATAWEKVKGSTLICPWAACAACARAIILAEISAVIVHYERMLLSPPHWREEIDFALEQLSNCGVSVLYYHGRVIGAPNILIAGKLWSPDSLEFVEC